jgi:hypothetical protein
VDKYTWQDVWSSFLPSDIVPRPEGTIEQAERITRERMTIWLRYHDMFAPEIDPDRFGKLRTRATVAPRSSQTTLAV